MNNFDYEGAKEAGYSDQEINDFVGNQPKYQPRDPNDSFLGSVKKNLSNFWESLRRGKTSDTNQPKETGPQIDQRLLKKVPKFDAEAALQSGYSPDEINDFLSDNQPKKSNLEKAGRVGMQYGLGRVQAIPGVMAYDIATSPLSSKSAMNQAYRETLGDDLEQLRDKKESGDWNEKDQELYDHLSEQMQDPEKSMKYAQTMDISSRDLFEKASGIDTHPEGFIEKAANWAGWSKNPVHVKELGEIGLSPKTLTKALFPSIKEGAIGAVTGTALQMAEEGQLGPLGTMAVAIAADLGTRGGIKTLEKLASPRKSAAQLVNFVTRASAKKESISQLVNDFKSSGLQIDAGTLTESPLVQMFQARLAQSGLTGKAFENFRKDLSGQIVREYENVLGDIGNIAFENNYQASEAIRDALRVEEVNLNIAKKQPQAGRSLQGRVSVEPAPPYQEELLNRIAPAEFVNDAQAGLNLKTAANDIKQPIKQEFEHRWTNFNNEIRSIEAGPQQELVGELENFVREREGSILLGESAPEARVLRSAQDLLEHLNPGGSPRGVSLDALIKTKRTLADIAKWEFGGSNFESAYKKLVGDIDNAINRSLEQASPELMQQYQQLNAEYSQFKDMFENKNLKSLFEPKNENYNQLLHEFTTNPDKLRSLEDIFYNNPRGQELVNQVKRDYAQRIIQNPRVTPREISNLANVLGPEYANEVGNFLTHHQYALEHPLPRVRAQQGLPVSPTAQAAGESRAVAGRAKTTGVPRANESVRRKMYEALSKKNPDQIMKQMDSIKGIRELKKTLELTPEGRELFKELTRYKLAEMIDNKMYDGVRENIKLGTFSNILKSSKDKAIVLELLGKESFNKLQLLQKNAGKLAQSAEKFYNASKSGTSLIDAGMVGAAFTGLFSGNPFLLAASVKAIGGNYYLAKLITDPVFLKELEKAILTNDPKKFQKYLEQISKTASKNGVKVLNNQTNQT